MRKLLLISLMVAAGCNRCCLGDETTKNPPASGIVYSNPRVYNVDYCFEMTPDPNEIDRARDLKLWIPIPREWDSQKAVKIISVEPEPHARYVDPEYGNPMLFWDFGKEPEQPSYKVDIKFRLESYDVSVKVDPNRVGSYDKATDEYALYTRGTRTISITPKTREMAQAAIGDEKNPYLRAKRILAFVRKKVNFKVLDFERGRGIKCLLDYPVIDERTGDEYYEGSCSQDTALFVALCRAVGIPARSVSGYIGWCPWMKPADLQARYPFEAKISPEGLAATQFYAGLDAHMWGECFIPNYGWIPTDGRLEQLNNRRWIMEKGRDIQVGPCAPQEKSGGYGAQWVALHNGRADLGMAVMNIGKIHNSKIKILHHSDPFPAAGLATYLENLAPSGEAKKNHKNWRQEVLSRPSCYVRNLVPENLNLGQFYKDYPRAKEDREAFVCYMLRNQLGDEVFFKLVKAYVDLRQKSSQAVPTSHFQKLAEDICGQSLDWFFDQWVNRSDLPQLKLEQVCARKDKENWQVQGGLLQLGETCFRLPIELALDTENGREMQRLWMDSKAIAFDFRTLNEPQKLIVDPDYEVLRVQKMPPSLWWFWDVYPKIMIVYGTLGETEANKTAAEQFNSDYLGLDREVVKADTDVNDADLKTKCVVLIGRPETNKIAQQFKDAFPIGFDKNTFTWQGVTYAKSTQAVAQIVENPGAAHNLIIMHAGLSPEATREFPFSYLRNAHGSYIIFEGEKQLLRGNWEDADSDLYRKFDTHPSVQSAPNKQ